MGLMYRGVLAHGLHCPTEYIAVAGQIKTAMVDSAHESVANFRAALADAQVRYLRGSAQMNTATYSSLHAVRLARF
jgi:hypothetical protein